MKFFQELILGAVIGGISAGILSFVVSFRVLRRSRVAMVSAYDIKCQAILDVMIAENLCDRALILKFHNGGGKVVAGKSKYASVLFEAHNDKVKSVRNEFQNYEVDPEYILLIQRVHMHRKVDHVTADMHSSMLRRRYELDNITAAHVPFFIETKGGMYYGSFSTTGPPDIWRGGKQFARLETLINQLRNIHVKSDRYRVLH